MGDSSPIGFESQLRRRWSFGRCTFDEASWVLTVDGQRVAMESKPLKLLRELLIHAGEVVSKDQLLDSIWPNVTVVEASLPTAVRKLRLAIGDNGRSDSTIETVPGIGYRMALPVSVEEVAANVPADVALLNERIEKAVVGTLAPRPRRKLPALLLLGSVAIASAALALNLNAARSVPPRLAMTPAQQAQLTVLRRLDVEAAEKMLAAGWDPMAAYDEDGNGALNVLLNICEWDPGHDQRRMLLMARTLIDYGAQIDQRNAWGDTPYSIAKAKRYCGPNHPVTVMLRNMCYGGDRGPRDRCLASYEIKRKRA
jgi:DNA-binding winged helix-turn-helix (wHTH) protein